MNEKRLVRYEDDKMVLGVASGLAHYFDIDPAIVRLAFVFAGMITAGKALILYVLLALIMPKAQPAAKYNAFSEDEVVIKEAT